MSKRHIRSMTKRFEIVLYHLHKIIKDWGQCQGLSGYDVAELKGIRKRLFKFYKEGKPFKAFVKEIDEKEFMS